MKTSKKRTRPTAAPKQPEPTPGGNAEEPVGKVLFEATIHAKRKDVNVDLIAHLDIDRVPDPKGLVRALLTAEDCVRLLNLGFEVRLLHAHPVRPLDRTLIETDESVRRWLRENLRGLIPDDASLDI